MANDLPTVSTDREPATDTAALHEVHKEALARADEAYTMERENIDEGREDQRFFVGGIGQWDKASQDARGTNRPMLTVNRMPAFIHQLTGEVRKNTPAIKVLPAKGEASKEKAEIYNGLIRNIEAESDADACYSIALENAGISGQGAFLIETEYEDDTSFDQVIRIRPCRDPFGVLIDPMARLPDKSDMRYGFIFERMTVVDFKEAFPGKSVDDMPMGVAGNNVSGLNFSWITGETVRIALYWCKEKTGKKTTLYLLEDGTVTDQKPPQGVAIKQQRVIEGENVVSYLMSGNDILSGPHPWAGKYIPICFVPGEEITIDGATKRKGIVRDAKDPQKLLNYARTTDAETTALQPKAPFVGTVNQFRGFEDVWATAGSQNHPFLPYNPDPLAPGPPQRSQPPVGSTALANLSVQAGQDLKDVIGLHDASLGARSNETSGVAIRARQREGDTGTFLYPDNLRRAIAYCGRILCDLIPRIYDTARVVRVLKEDGSHDMAPVNQPAVGPNGEQGVDPETDLTLGRYDVQVSTGKSYLTRQEEMADDLVQLAGNMPIIGQVASDLVVKALNFPGGDELAARLERTIPLQVREDPQNLPPQPPSPDQVKAAAEAGKAEADAAKATAEAEGTQLDNLSKAHAMLMTLQGIPDVLAAMQQQLAMLAGAQQQHQPNEGPPPGGPGAPGGPMPGGPPPEGMPQGMPGAPDGGDMAELEPIGGPA